MPRRAQALFLGQKRKKSGTAKRLKDESGRANGAAAKAWPSRRDKVGTISQPEGYLTKKPMAEGPESAEAMKGP